MMVKCDGKTVDNRGCRTLLVGDRRTLGDGESGNMGLAERERFGTPIDDRPKCAHITAFYYHNALSGPR